MRKVSSQNTFPPSPHLYIFPISTQVDEKNSSRKNAAQEGHNQKQNRLQLLQKHRNIQFAGAYVDLYNAVNIGVPICSTGVSR